MVHLFFFSVLPLLSILFRWQAGPLPALWGFAVSCTERSLLSAHSQLLLWMCACVCVIYLPVHTLTVPIDGWLTDGCHHCHHRHNVFIVNVCASHQHQCHVLMMVMCQFYPLFSAFSFIVHLLTLNMNVWERKREGGKERRFSLTKKKFEWTDQAASSGTCLFGRNWFAKYRWFGRWQIEDSKKGSSVMCVYAFWRSFSRCLSFFKFVVVES